MGANQGPQVFIFNGETTEQLQYDSISGIKSITVDSEDNIWCIGYGGYAVYVSVFAIEQSQDNKIWIGTGDGIYIND